MSNLLKMYHTYYCLTFKNIFNLRRHFARWLRAQAFETGGLVLNPSSATFANFHSGMLFNLSLPQLYSLQNGDNLSTWFIWVLWGWCDDVHKTLSLCLADTTCSVSVTYFQWCGMLVPANKGLRADCWIFRILFANF